MGFGSLYGMHSEGYRSPDHRLPSAPEPAHPVVQGVGCLVAIVIFSGAVWGFFNAPNIANALLTKEGRGPKITACPKGYPEVEGLRVTDEKIIARLGQVARENYIADTFASVPFKSYGLTDKAEDAGELACTRTDGETRLTFLLPAGLEALQAMRTTTLPDGLLRTSIRIPS